jgi:hypothetical protein
MEAEYKHLKGRCSVDLLKKATQLKIIIITGMPGPNKVTVIQNRQNIVQLASYLSNETRKLLRIPRSADIIFTISDTSKQFAIEHRFSQTPFDITFFQMARNQIVLKRGIHESRHLFLYYNE